MFSLFLPEQIGFGTELWPSKVSTADHNPVDDEALVNNVQPGFPQYRGIDLDTPDLEGNDSQVICRVRRLLGDIGQDLSPTLDNIRIGYRLVQRAKTIEPNSATSSEPVAVSSQCR